MITIGLTGGIGTGKSTVSDFLHKKGYYIIDADKIAHQITEKGTETLKELVNYFGPEILLDTGELDRRALAQIAFSNEEKLFALETLTTDVVVEKIRKEIISLRQSQKYNVIFVDAPLLFETGLNSYCDEVWLIDADLETRIKRVMERDGLSRQEVISRIRNQMSSTDKAKLSTLIIDNSKGKDELFNSIEKLLGEYV